MKKVLLTGATGVIGRRLLPALVEAGHQVHAVTRSPEKAKAVTAAGAQATSLDLFDEDAVADAVVGCDAVVHLATNIPVGMSMVRKSAWEPNNRLRDEAANNLAAAVIHAGVPTYVGESTTFPYLDAGSDWIDEEHACSYHAMNQSCVDSEAAAQRVTDAGLTGVCLRFAMFHDEDSSHIQTFLSAAEWGFSPFVGAADAYQSFIDTRDAAKAVIAALDVAPGIYNVAEPNPSTRGQHVAELATLLGRTKLRSTPRFMEKVGGAEMEQMARSQRISSQALQEAGAWESQVHVIDRWEDLT